MKRPQADAIGAERQTQPSQINGAQKKAVRDAASALLRLSFSRHLRNAPYLPPGLAQTLADDVETVPLRACEAAGSVPRSGANACPNGRAPIHLAAFAEAVYELSQRLRDLLVVRHSLPEQLADRIALHGREGTLIRAVAPEHEPQALHALITYLAERDGLTPNLLLRALCLGHLALFEIAVAHLASTTTEEAARSIRCDETPRFAELYERSGLPTDLYRAFRVAVKAHRRLTEGRAEAWNHGNTDKVIEGLVQEYENLGPEDLEHVLSQLGRASADPLLAPSSRGAASA